MAFNLPLWGTKTYGRTVAAAGTVINRLVEPMRNASTVIAHLTYQQGVTLHTITIMRPLGSTTVASAASANQAVINITADPGVYASGTRIANNAIAANDYVVYRCSDGTFVLDTVASVSSLAITMTTNVPSMGVPAGAPFWFFGTINDTNPCDSQSHPKFIMAPGYNGTLTSSNRIHLGDQPGDSIAGVLASFGLYEPLIIQSDNVTTTGTIEQVVTVYTSRMGPNTPNTSATTNA